MCKIPFCFHIFDFAWVKDKITTYVLDVVDHSFICGSALLCAASSVKTLR